MNGIAGNNYTFCQGSFACLWLDQVLKSGCEGVVNRNPGFPKKVLKTIAQFNDVWVVSLGRLECNYSASVDK